MKKTIASKRPFPHYKFPHEIVITYRKMNIKECNWHNVATDSYQLTCENYGWFPTSILMGVDERGMYTDTLKIGAKNGNNLGTASIAVTNYTEAIKLLKAAGYNIKEHF